MVEWAGVDTKTGMGTWWYDKKDAQGNVTREKLPIIIWLMQKLVKGIWGVLCPNSEVVLPILSNTEVSI